MKPLPRPTFAGIFWLSYLAAVALIALAGLDIIHAALEVTS